MSISADSAPRGEPSAITGKSPIAQLGRYTILFRFAAGGMAEVFVGRLRGAGGFEKPVAIKRMLPSLAEETRFVDMFLDEARIAAMITSPNVVPTLDVDTDDEGAPYIVMELVVGASLSQLQRGMTRQHLQVPIPVAVEVIAQAAQGLHDAHDATRPSGERLELVHRDVSPQNILVGVDGRARIMDFGIARALERVTQTSTGEVKGKLAYMAPEQLLGQTLDRRTDIWALGVVLWEVLMGRRLFRGSSDGETVQRVMNDRIAKPSEAGAPYRTTSMPAIPKSLDRIVAKATAREAHQRFATAAELADAIEDVLHEEGARAGGKEVQDWMREVFADRRAMREAMLRKEMPEGIVPSVELETARTLVTPKPDVNFSNAQTTPRAVAPPPPPPKAARETKPWQLALVGGAALGATLAFGMWLGRTNETPAPPQLHALPPMPTRAEPALTPTARELSQPVPSQVAAEPSQHAVEPSQVAVEPSQVAAEPSQVAVEPSQPLVETPISEPVQNAPRPRDVRPRPPVESRATGNINVLAIPPARIYLRGRALGETPLANVSLPVGTHELEARPSEGSGPVRRQRVTVVEGETARVLFR